jgi:serine O-acetyltransferase
MHAGGELAGHAIVSDLGGLVARLREVRAAGDGSHNGASASLPRVSRAAVLALRRDFIAALFPGQFGPQDLSGDGLHGFVTHTIDVALRSLETQLAREVAHELEPGADTAHRAREIRSEFASALPDVLARLNADVRAAFEGDPAAKSLDEVLLSYPGVIAIIHHRLAHELYRLGAPLIARILAEAAHSETGIDIHPGAEIGEGFFIDHGTGVVIGETAVIGRRVRLYQAVTLGARRFNADQHGGLAKNYPRHPIIEDDVVIYAGATVLGRITIGRGSQIGGNVWLTRDVPPGSNVTQARPRTEAFDDGSGI